MKHILALDAYVAGLAVGCWSNVSEVSEKWQVDRRFEPSMDRGGVDALTTGWKKALDRARAWEETDA